MICCTESDSSKMVGNPQGRDRGLETLENIDADQVWNKEHYAQVYMHEKYKGSCGVMY
jgi:hypothetical protein